MEGFYDWIRNITSYLIFITVFSNILPDKKYEKYMRLFAGMVLILLVLKPVTGGLRIEEKIAYYYKSITFSKEVEALERESSRLEEERRARMFSQYREAIGLDVSRMAESAGFSVREVRVEVDEGDGGGSGESGDEGGRGSASAGLGAVKTIRLTVASEDSGSQSGQAADPVEIHVDEIVVSPQESQTSPDSPSEADETAAAFEADWDRLSRQESGQAVNRLRRQIAGYYNLEEAYVEIKMEDE